MLPQIARRRLQALRAQTPALFTEPLLDFIPRVTPKWTRPDWLKPYSDLLERAFQEPIRVVVAAPPQHGKTETTLHGLNWGMRKKPGRRHAYATYGQERAERQSDKARHIAERDGQQYKWRREFWEDGATGGSILWTSIGGPFTGEPVDGVLIIDDPLKDRREAESGTTRQQIIDWFDDVAEPRCHPGSSIIVMATRWHPDDLSGQLVKRGWPYVNLKAIAEGSVGKDGRIADDPLRRRPGEPLCEARKPLADLEEKRRTNIYTFASLYQGMPRPRGGNLFGSPYYYDELPDMRRGYRVAYGVDLAYSAKKSSDFSVIIRIIKIEDRYYVTDVVRKQVDAPSFLLTLKARHSEQPGPMLWIASGTEKGTAQFIQERVPLDVEQATEDKFQRALAVSEAWNAGTVLVPRDAEWLDEFIEEVCSFTGVKDAHDDQVDALAAAHKAIEVEDIGATIIHRRN